MPTAHVSPIHSNVDLPPTWRASSCHPQTAPLNPTPSWLPTAIKSIVRESPGTSQLLNLPASGAYTILGLTMAYCQLGLSLSLDYGSVTGVFGHVTFPQPVVMTPMVGRDLLLTYCCSAPLVLFQFCRTNHVQCRYSPSVNAWKPATLCIIHGVFI